MPVTPAPPAAGAAAAAAGAAPVAPGQVDQYPVVDPPWYRQPGPLAGIAIGVLVLLGIGGFLLFANNDADDADVVVSTDVNDSVQLEISRITRTEAAVSATLTATVTGPAASPAEYEWILPAGAQAPEPAVGVTDQTGRLKFVWSPVDQLTADTTWSSTVTIDEVLPPNATLADTRFECVLNRNSATSNIIIEASLSPEPVTEQRNVTYSFANTEFVAGDSVTCPILSGDENLETTTTVPESTTTLPETTTTDVTTTTVVPTTLPPTTVAPAPVVTASTTTTTTTVAPKTTVISIIEGRTDLSTFSNLINRAGLREQLAAQTGTFTVVAPNNAAIEALLATAGAPDLNDPTAARDFVLAHVKTGMVLKGSDIAAMQAITFDFGPERVVDATVSPITIGGAKVIDTGVPADLGVVHTLDRTLVTPAP